MIESELKACPFCGENSKKDMDLRVPVTYFITCTYCGAEGSHHSNESDAIEHWNKREGSK